MDADHLVVIGDAREMRELPSGSVHLIVTSPPHLNFSMKSARVSGVINDFDDYLQHMVEVFKECRRVLQNGHFLCINLCDSISNLEKMPIPAHIFFALHKAGFRFCEDVFWGTQPKFPGLNGHQSDLLSSCVMSDLQVQRTLVFRKGERNHSNLLGASMGWDAAGELSPTNDPVRQFQDMDARVRLHPDVFSEQLVEALISHFTAEGETVLDPFLGTGTLSRVAAHLHRNSVGYDNDGYHAQLIRQKAGIPDGHLKVVFREEGRLT